MAFFCHTDGLIRRAVIYHQRFYLGNAADFLGDGGKDIRKCFFLIKAGNHDDEFARVSHGEKLLFYSIPKPPCRQATI